MIPLSFFFYFKLLKLFSAVFLVAKVSNKGNLKKKKKGHDNPDDNIGLFSQTFSPV